MRNAGFIALVLVTGVAVGGSAALAKPGFGPRPSFEELDADGSGEISAEEMQMARTRHFESADTDGDGMLSLEEMQAQGRKRADDRAAKMIEQFDKNGDSALSADELPKPRRSGQMFERLDTDGSGGISAEEFAEARDRMMEHRKRWHGKKKRDGAGQTGNN